MSTQSKIFTCINTNKFFYLKISWNRMKPKTPTSSQKQSLVTSKSSSSKKLSKSVKRLREILKEDEEDIPKQALCVQLLRNEAEVDSRYFLLPIKMIYWFHHKAESYLSYSWKVLRDNSSRRASQTGKFYRIIEKMWNETQNTAKILFFRKISAFREKCVLKGRAMRLFVVILERIRRKMLSEIFAIVSPPSTETMPSQPFSQGFMDTLLKLKKYEKSTFYSLTTIDFQRALRQEMELNSISNPKNKNNGNNELILVVLRNLIKGLIDINNEGEQIVKSFEEFKKTRRSLSQLEKDVMLVQYHEEALDQFQDQEEKLMKLILEEGDFLQPELLIEEFIEDNENARERIMKSRMRVLTIVMELCRNMTGKLKPTLEKGKNSIHEMGVSRVRTIIQELDEKVYELSTISEQIPQLETFQRTLDLTMPEHNTYFTKIVNVLIELHHKINQLLNRRPEHLQKQINEIEEECAYIEVRLTEFLEILESQTQQKLKPITYSSKISSKSPEHFRRLQKLTSSLSEHILYSLSLENQTQQKFSRIKYYLDLFWNLFEGMQEFEREWSSLKSKIQNSDEEQIYEILDTCLKIFSQKKEEFQQILDDYESKLRMHSADYAENNQYLEEEVIQISQQNQSFKQKIEELTKQIDEEKKNRQYLERTNQEQEQLIKKLNRSLEIIEKREKIDKERIAALEGENQHKKTIINNLNHQIKSKIKDSEASKKYEQKIKELNTMIDNLNKEKSQSAKAFQQQRNKFSADLQKYAAENQKLKVKLDENSKIVHERESEIHKLKQTIIKMENQYSEIKKEINLSCTSQEIERSEEVKKELKAQISKKQEKIEELGQKIIELNDKMTEMVQKYSSMEHKIKTFEQKERNYKKKITEFEHNHHSLESYKKNQDDLNKALQQLKDSHQIAQELQQQIKRRENLIQNLQSIIAEQTEKYTFNEQQWEDSEQKYNKQIQSLRKMIKEKTTILQKIQSQIKQKETDSSQKQKIKDLEKRILSHEKQIGTLSGEINKKDAQINKLANTVKNLTIEKSNLQNAQQKSQHKIQQLQRNNEVEYLKEKIRSLQDLVDIFTEQHAILEAKWKEHRNYQDSMFLHNESLLKYEQDKSQKTIQLSELSQKVHEQTSYIQSLQQSLHTMQEKVKESEKYYSPGKKIVHHPKQFTPAMRLQDDETDWIEKQKTYVEKIKNLEIELRKVRDEDKYYLKIEGKKLEQMISQIEHGTSNLQFKVDEVLSNSRKSSKNQDSAQLAEHNRLLIEQIKKVLLEKEQISHVLKQYPKPEYVTEFVFKIILYFSQISSQSPQGSAIWEQLQQIRAKYSGGQYFVVLEEFTKYNLEENAIEVYRQQLKVKAEQLQSLKNKLDLFIKEQIQSEERLVKRTTFSESRYRQRERYLSEISKANVRI